LIRSPTCFPFPRLLGDSAEDRCRQNQSSPRFFLRFRNMFGSKPFPPTVRFSKIPPRSSPPARFFPLIRVARLVFFRVLLIGSSNGLIPLFTFYPFSLTFRNTSVLPLSFVLFFCVFFVCGFFRPRSFVDWFCSLSVRMGLFAVLRVCFLLTFFFFNL